MISLNDNSTDCFHNFIFSNNFYVCEKCGIVLPDTNIECSERYNMESLQFCNLLNLKSTKLPFNTKYNSTKFKRLAYMEAKFNNLNLHDKFMALVSDNCTLQSYNNYVNSIKYLKTVNAKAKFIYMMLSANEHMTYKRFITLCKLYNIRVDKRQLMLCKKPKLPLDKLIFQHLFDFMNRYHFSIDNPFEVVKAVKCGVNLIRKVNLTVNVNMIIDTILIKTLKIEGITQNNMADEIGKEKYEKSSIKNYFRFINLISDKIESMRNDFKSCIIQ